MYFQKFPLDKSCAFVLEWINKVVTYMEACWKQYPSKVQQWFTAWNLFLSVSSYLSLKELLNYEVLMPTVSCLILKKCLLSSSVYSEILHLTEADHEVTGFFSFHMARIKKEMWNAETGLKLHLSWLASPYTYWLAKLPLLDLLVLLCSNF